MLAAEFGDAYLTAKLLRDDPDLLLR